MMSKFKVGDVVTLSSSADVRMNIQSVDGIRYTCVWFDKYRHLQHQEFEESLLRKLPKSPPKTTA